MESHLSAMSRARRVFGNVLVVFVSVLLAGSAIAKFMKVPAVAGSMAQLGFSGARLQFIAVLEIVSALLFLVPRTRAAGLLLGSAYMGGAIATHVGHGGAMAGPAVAVLTFLWVAAAVREPEVLGRLSWR